MRSVIILFLSMIFLAGCANSETVQQTTERTEATQASEATNTNEKLQIGEVMQIRVGNVVGNGVLWEKTDEKLIVATAGHLFEMGNGDAEVTVSDGLTVAATSYEVVKPDLAFVLIDAKQIPAEQLAQFQTVSEEKQDSEVEGTESLQNDEKVLLKAFGTDGVLQLHEGTVLYSWIYIEDFEAHMILADLDVEQGMSGGGLFDQEGHFLGVLCGVSEDGEAGVIPLSVMQAAYVTISEKF